MAYGNVSTGLLRAQNERLREQIAEVEAQLSRNNAAQAANAASLAQVEHRRATLDEWAVAAKALDAKRLVGELSEADWAGASHALLQSYKEAFGGGGDYEALVVQLEVLMRKGDAA